MAAIIFRAIPFDKSFVTLALESGVDGIIAPESEIRLVSGLARCPVFADKDFPMLPINSKKDEEEILDKLKQGAKTCIARGWEIIPIENLLAQSDNIFAETESIERAELANGILEKGVAGLVVPPEAIGQLKEIIARCKISQGTENLIPARITRIENAGLGHRVCLDTLSLLKKGQGALIGNSSAFTFLVHAETEHNEYVASRPFRINAGAVHAYIRLPHDRTSYLSEMKAGDEIVVVNQRGESATVTLGRVKIEIRPMLLIEAQAVTMQGEEITGSIFLQNAETIRLTSPNGQPVSVVSLQPGDEILCRLDDAGRHFGMRIKEDIREV